MLRNYSKLLAKSSYFCIMPHMNSPHDNNEKEPEKVVNPVVKNDDKSEKDGVKEDSKKEV